MKPKTLRRIEFLRRHLAGTWTYDPKRNTYLHGESGRTIQFRVGFEEDSSALPYWTDDNSSFYDA